MTFEVHVQDDCPLVLIQIASLVVDQKVQDVRQIVARPVDARGEGPGPP